MNKTNFVQTGGFPVKAERLQELQTAYEIFNQFGNLAGNLTIISGCGVVGTNVANGFVFINNEILEFRAGTLATNVIIIEVPSSKEFKNGEVKEVHYERYATFGTAATSYPWESFKRLDPIVTLMARLDLLEKKSAVFQSGGGMLFWNRPANEIPEGWSEVVNWRGRIPVGLDTSQTEFNVIGKQGGSKTKSLSSTELAPHTHSYKDIYYSEAGGTVWVPSNRGSGDTDSDNKGYEIDRTTGSTGSGTAFSIMNPYRVVMFIEWVGI